MSPSMNDNDADFDLPRAIGNLEGKMDLLLESSKSHDKRIRKLEGYKAWLAGAVALFSFAFSYIVDWVRGSK